MDQPMPRSASGSPVSSFVTAESVTGQASVPLGLPDFDDIDDTPDYPPVIRTAEGLRQLQEMLDRPPRDMPKLQRLLQQTSPFTDG